MNSLYFELKYKLKPYFKVDKTKLTSSSDEEFFKKILTIWSEAFSVKLKKGEYIGVEKDGKYSKVWITVGKVYGCIKRFVGIIVTQSN